LKVKKLSFPALIFILFIPVVSLCNDPPKFILIHLDGASGIYFMEEIEKGNLTNLASYFGEEGIIDHTITYFPSKTPTVISSIRLGSTIREAPLPGWEWVVDKTEDVVVKTVGTFLRMVFSTSRLSTTNILYGIPVFHWLAGPALINTADYLKDYNILEFYWYNIDTQGHFRGKEAYLKEFAKFDKYFGKLMKRIDDDVNIIIYSDHGMTFDEGIAIDSEVKELVATDLNVYSYPVLYLKESEKAEYYSEKILRETNIDFTFFRKSDTEMVGFHRNGNIYFEKNYDDLTLSYTYDCSDVLGYSDLGYTGEFLSHEEWLNLTYNTNYPMAPVVLFHFMVNPGTGDIITLFESGKYQKTGYSKRGNHGGFTDHDMKSVLLVKGPNLEFFYDKDAYWLPNLFHDIKGVDFKQHPQRERHYISSRYDFRKNRFATEFSVSPKYRIKYGATSYNSDLNSINQFDRIDFWGKADLFRSYLSRFWIGTGFELKDSQSSPILILQYDLHVKKWFFKIHSPQTGLFIFVYLLKLHHGLR
jgi:hypothetical protein